MQRNPDTHAFSARMDHTSGMRRKLGALLGVGLLGSLRPGHHCSRANADADTRKPCTGR
ncbi:hypothetical protein [Deinococcus arenicola]|uniref:Uncharacterized protein n=1 Tax=Deinococcus arenicola TaxID=2994950 RepID=A0ABU4DRS1_9DEIO|nr:hypothetical protein [Deinococcus sp. ZS9-10]MDV6374570.1 hypothetical protein [Deinococcus sp. ZS9-10]